MKRYLWLALLVTASACFGQQSKSGFIRYKGTLHRDDGNNIVFAFDLNTHTRKPLMKVVNGKEQLTIDSIYFAGDSVFFKMPFFESSFRARIADGKWQGEWLKQTSRGMQTMPFSAEPLSERFKKANGAATTNVSGRWEVHFDSDSAAGINAVAEFTQQGDKLTGSFLTTTGDYRFLEGIVTGNKLLLSAFDGSHAFLFTADVSQNKIANGKFYSGLRFTDNWTATKNKLAKVPQDASAMYVRPGESKLDFAFPDLDRNLVSINDPRFKNKVTIIQLMGSWCPNCMDETAFLTNLYAQNKQRGVEVVALAYEYGSDFNKSLPALLKYKRRLQVNYPILFTGVSVTDSLRTEKTLPQVTPIKVFPSSIIIDKKGDIRKLDNGFNGPGTGEHYERYKEEFNSLINKLLSEK